MLKRVYFFRAEKEAGVVRKESKSLKSWEFFT